MFSTNLMIIIPILLFVLLGNEGDSQFGYIYYTKIASLPLLIAFLKLAVSVI